LAQISGGVAVSVTLVEGWVEMFCDRSPIPGPFFVLVVWSCWLGVNCLEKSEAESLVKPGSQHIVKLGSRPWSDPEAPTSDAPSLC